MKYGSHIFPVLLIPALIGIAAAFRPKATEQRPKTTEHRVAEIETIECGPTTTGPLPDANGKFIPLLPGLGNHTYQISTEQDSARLFFNQGLNLYYSYHLQEANASFKEAARFDSTAAMIYWGQALSMGPYYNSYGYKMRAGVPAALAAMTRHRSTATEKEKGLIDAILQRYSSDFTNTDRSHLDSAYAKKMSALVAQYPADNDIKALYIDAVMLQHKWDFWHTDRTPKQWTPELVTLCQTILKKDPHHPAALHYYIHLTEASGQPELALAGADILKNDMPGAGHMVHMATHMYQRNGLFAQGVTVNEDANTAYNLEDSLAPALGLGRNNVIHVFAVQSYCAMTAGMYKQGIPIYQRTRDQLVAAKPAFEKEPYSQYIYMFPVMALVRLGKWDEVMQAPMPDPHWKYATILAHFARGMANVHYIDLRAAAADLDSIQINLSDSLLGVRMMPFDKPSQCGSIAAGILRGEILFAQGKQNEAVNSLTRAVKEEDALIYREPQQWLIPVRQYLGVVLLKMRQPAAAEKVYRADLFRNPGNGWSLLGLYQSLLAQQKSTEAANVKTKYLAAFASCDVNPAASAFCGAGTQNPKTQNASAQNPAAQKIDRYALVTRHNLHITDRDVKGPTQVGNGHFAFGFDITGLQTFNPGANTLSEWGWHRFPLPAGSDPYHYNGREWNTQGRWAHYDVDNLPDSNLYRWMRGNPHRLNLGRLKFVLKTRDGRVLTLKDLGSPVQDLNLWTGIAVSSFYIENKKVVVTTIGDPDKDAVAIKVDAPQLDDGQVMLQLDFPYATHQEFGNGTDWNNPDKHTTLANIGRDSAIFHRTLDSTRYDVVLLWKGGGKLEPAGMHSYLLKPAGHHSIELVLNFVHDNMTTGHSSFTAIEQASIRKWATFWSTGGAIDLSASKDPRWKELERRIVLSEYLMAVNESGQLPPQESGLVNNGWFGKYHFEMLWWHAAHYGLWGRSSTMEDLTRIYRDELTFYMSKAKEQGYQGVRWPKTLGDHDKWEWPNEINPLLIWQQPHPIFFAELDYRNHPTQETIDRWKDVVLQTADFLASYPYYKEREQRYILGYPLQVVSENADPHTTINPTFELSYWRTGLRLAQVWRKRLGFPPNEKYDEVLAKLSALPVQNGTYVSWENIYSMWSVYNFEHPALIGAYGMLPGDGVDVPTMDSTLNMVQRSWHFDRTWGWDFPMLAMSAARLGHPDRAIDFLLNYPSFTWDEHGFSGGGFAPYPYFPANGGLLYVVAMMAAGWDGSTGSAPGFPKDGSWTVKSEGLVPAL